MWCKGVHIIWALAFLWTHGAAAKVLLISANTSSFTFDSSEANFTPRVKGSGVSGLLMFGNPVDACSSLHPISTLGSLFLLAMRGDCSFETKIRYGQDAGFAAIIIYNNESSSDLVTMTGSSDGISTHAVFVSQGTGEALAKYANDSNSLVWILPTYEDTVWSAMVFSLILLLAIAAALATWYFVRRHRDRQLGRRFPTRNEEPCLMSLRVVQAMPSIIYKVSSKEKAAQESCVICLEDYVSGIELRVLPCGHRFHCTCVDAWLTMWRAVCPVCKRDARYEFPDLQVSERTPLLSFLSGRGRSYNSLSESPPIQIPSSHPDCMDIPCYSNKSTTSASSSQLRPSSILRRSSVDCSLEAFRVSPYFTPPSYLNQSASSSLYTGAYGGPSSRLLLDSSAPVIGSPSSASSGSRNMWGKSYLNPGKASHASGVRVGSSSPLSCSSHGSQVVKASSLPEL